MEDTPKIAREMINPQTRSHLYEFDRSETRSPGTVALLIRTDPYNIITEFYVINMGFPYNAILRRPWIHIMKAILSSYH